MKRGNKEHEDAWVNYVATNLGFNQMPEDLTSRARMLYQRGWTAPEAIENFKQYLSMPNNN